MQHRVEKFSIFFTPALRLRVCSRVGLAAVGQTQRRRDARAVDVKPIRPSAPVAEPFIVMAERAFGEVAGSLRELVGALPGKIDRAVDVERALRIDKRLAWQVFRLSRSGDLRESVNVPAKSSIERLSMAAAKVGVAESVIRGVDEAHSEFERFTREHAGDRDTLLTMISGSPSARDEQLELRVREGLFRGNAHVWGVRVGSLTRTTVMLPGSAGGSGCDELVVSSVGQIEQLRDDGRAAYKLWIRRTPKQGEALKPVEGSEPTFSILENFCSRPIPQLTQQWSNEVGGLETEIRLPCIGKTGAADLCFAHLVVDAAAEADLPLQANAFMTSPIREMTYDMMVPVGWTDVSSARFACFGNRYRPARAFEKHSEDRMPLALPVAYLGRLRGRFPSTPVSPRHGEAVGEAMSKFAPPGAADLTFDCFRCVIEYPIMHTLVSLAVDDRRTRS